MRESEHADPEDTASNDGVDVTLIQWMLSLTPAQRLDVLRSNNRSLEALRGAAARR